ncbi:acyltransferase [Vibrio metschnikovii]|uniref:acyltransferase n=1 Tax=Vibrio metschnikovii TaxID=28172 RepID=UPI001C30F3F8|nr:acyltransferase [Vibrio metschnikovii]
MRGREFFRIFKLFLFMASWILKLFPRFLSEWFWIFSDLFPGRLGVSLRYILAKRLAKSLGDCVFFGRGVEVKSWQNLSIGSNVSFHKDCYIDASGGITIFNDVSIAHGCSLLSFDHTWSDNTIPIRSNSLVFNHILIDSDVWVGCGVRILSGVTIHSRSVIAAGAIVTKDIVSNTLVAGIPAKVIKKI